MEPIRILIVDDDASVCLLLKAAFVGASFDVSVANSALDGLEWFRGANWDIVLIDKNLPGISGIELLRAIREEDQVVPCLIMTGYGSAESARQAMGLGIDSYLEKPFDDVFAVVERVRSIVDHAHKRSRARGTQPSYVHPLPDSESQRAARLLLLARDAAEFREVLAPLSERIVVVSATTLEEAEEQIRREPPALMVIDIVGEAQSLGPLLGHLKRESPASRCVLVHPLCPLATLLELIDLGVDRVVERPLIQDEFLAKVRTLLDFAT